jgi:hypothetical protein
MDPGRLRRDIEEILKQAEPVPPDGLSVSISGITIGGNLSITVHLHGGASEGPKLEVRSLEDCIWRRAAGLKITVDEVLEIARSVTGLDSLAGCRPTQLRTIYELLADGRPKRGED